jgi:hypothetical protein
MSHVRKTGLAMAMPGGGYLLLGPQGGGARSSLLCVSRY